MLKNLGFTLIELLVVIGIIAAMVALLLPQLGGFNRAQSLKNAALSFQTALRQAQNNATSGVKCNTTTASSDWHVNIGAGGGSYTIESTCSGGALGTSTTYSLPTGITVSGITRIENYAQACIFDTIAGKRVSFNNISGEVTLYPDIVKCSANPSTTTGFLFTLTLAADNSSAYVTVGKGGSIYIVP